MSAFFVFLFAVGGFDTQTIGQPLPLVQNKVIYRYASFTFSEIPPIVCFLCHCSYMWGCGNICSRQLIRPIMSFELVQDTEFQQRPKRRKTILFLVPPESTEKPKKQKRKRVHKFDGFRQYDKGPKVKRACLCCGHSFPSTGIGNRICKRCKEDLPIY